MAMLDWRILVGVVVEQLVGEVVEVETGLMAQLFWKLIEIQDFKLFESSSGH